MARKWIKTDGIGTLTDKILHMSNIKKEDRQMFLHGTVADIRSGLDMIDADKAIKIIRQAIEDKKVIVNYTDGNDCDGSEAGAVTVGMITELGGTCYHYSNNRFTQGYGMCKSGVDELLEAHPDTYLIITTDNGVAAHEAADYALSKGLKLVITDHHEVPETLPNAHAIVDPKRKDCPSKFKEICGTTVIWKLLRELYDDKSKANKYLDFVAIATVGDVMPLIDENRIMVKEGLKLLNNESRFSLKILKELTKASKIDATNVIGFQYVPMVNAVGRLDGNIGPIIDTFLSSDEAFIRDNLTRFIALNEERKAITEEQTLLASTQVDESNLPPFLLLYHPDFHEGIVGLIAGRLKEKYNRPTIVMTKGENGDLKGSARSIEGFDIKENLDKCKDLLGGYGGHPLAAGLSLKEENLNALREKLTALANELLTEEHFAKKYYYVERYREHEITQELVEEFKELEPYGPGFPKPLIRLDSFDIHRVMAMGKDKNHLRLSGEKLTVIGWRQVEAYQKRGTPLRVTALGTPELNVFNNNVNVQFMIDGDNFM